MKNLGDEVSVVLNKVRNLENGVFFIFNFLKLFLSLDKLGNFSPRCFE
ncbi:MAG: hypothetical protein LBD03_02720 [Methanobrevibacter sp.]|nr:hypothetical protein [Candidatus Methanovirga procula]